VGSKALQMIGADAEQTDSYTCVSDLPGPRSGDLGDGLGNRDGVDKDLEETRQQRAEGHAVAERHSHAPHGTKEVGPPERAWGLLAENAQKIAGHQPGEKPRAYDPGKEAAAEPMEQDTKEGIRGHLADILIIQR